MTKYIVLALFICLTSSCYDRGIGSSKDNSDKVPVCIKSKIEEIKNAEPTNPPLSVYRYSYQGRKVYFIPQHCCDIPSILMDENCITICSPDGGITGKGDGKCADFFDTRTNEELLWKDERDN